MYNKLVELRNQARKAGDKDSVAIYQVALGDMDRVIGSKGKITDKEAEKVIKKIVEGNKEILSHKADPTLERENEILEKLLPKQLTRDETAAILNRSEIEAAGNMGLAMKAAMKQTAGHQVDNKIVSEIVREYLK